MSQTPDSSFNKLIQELKSSMPEGFKSSELPKRQFIYEDVDLGPLAGYPSVRFICPETQMELRICPTPLIGVSDTYIDCFFYQLAILTPHKFSTKEVTKTIAGLLETFSMSALSRVQTQNGNKIPSAGEPSGQSFVILITSDPDVISGHYCYNAMAAVEVGSEPIRRHIESLERQLQDIAEIYRSTESRLQPPKNL
jgi:hypothetical protein